MMESKTETAVTTLLSDIASTHAELLPVIQRVRQLATALGDNVCESVRFAVCRTDEQPLAFARRRPFIFYQKCRSKDSTSAVHSSPQAFRVICANCASP